MLPRINMLDGIIYATQRCFSVNAESESKFAKYIREIEGQIDNLLWGKTRAWGQSIHEKKLSSKMACFSPFYEYK